MSCMELCAASSSLVVTLALGTLSMCSLGSVVHLVQYSKVHQRLHTLHGTMYTLHRTLYSIEACCHDGRHHCDLPTDRHITTGLESFFQYNKVR